MESVLFFSQNLSSDRKDFVLEGKEGASGRISSGLKVARSTILDSVRVRVYVRVTWPSISVSITGQWASESEGRRELRSGTFRSRAPAPNSPARGQRFAPVTFPLGRPRATNAATRFAEFSVRKVGYRLADTMGVSASTRIPPKFLLRQLPVSAATRTGTGTGCRIHARRKLLAPRSKIFIRGIFQRNNAVFHPVPLRIPRTINLNHLLPSRCYVSV